MTQEKIIETLLDFIDADDERAAVGSTTSNEVFNEIALELYRYQFSFNQPFRHFSSQRGRTPRTVKSWQDIPLVPINAFKKLCLSCCRPEDAPYVFTTSGTTETGVKGKSYHSSLDVYDASMTRGFKEFFIADKDSIEMSILYPTEEVMPNSSLAHYLTLAIKNFGTPRSAYVMNHEGIDFEALFERLKKAEANKEPHALLGASYSYIPLLEEMRAREISFSLPTGSRLFDTGGFKTKSNAPTLDDFYTDISKAFGVPRDMCINMYGMTELSTQFYDQGNVVCPSVKFGPHWIKTRVVNPVTGRELPQGERGVLAHCDLAHFNIVTSILTEDAGIATADGFKLLGRADGNDAKGCSMAVEEFLNAAQT